MKEKNTQMWVPMYVDKWLFGSTRLELEPGERSVFVDLIMMGAKDDGYIRANETIPYLPRQLAAFLNVDESLLLSAVAKCIQYGKLEEVSPGMWRICNWDKYQLSKSYKSEISSGKKAVPGIQRTESSLQRTDGSPIREKKIEEERREGEYIKSKNKFLSPSIEQVRELAKAEGLSADPDRFFHHQESKGGWDKIVDWKSAFRAWDRAEFKDKHKQVQTTASNPDRTWKDTATPIIKAKNAWHEDHTKEGKCFFCGSSVPGIDVCHCSAYTESFKEFCLKEGFPV